MAACSVGKQPRAWDIHTPAGAPSPSSLTAAPRLYLMTPQPLPPRGSSTCSSPPLPHIWRTLTHPLKPSCGVCPLSLLLWPQSTAVTPDGWQASIPLPAGSRGPHPRPHQAYNIFSSGHSKCVSEDTGQISIAQMTMLPTSGVQSRGCRGQVSCQGSHVLQKKAPSPCGPLSRPRIHHRYNSHRNLPPGFLTAFHVSCSGFSSVFLLSSLVCVDGDSLARNGALGSAESEASGSAPALPEGVGFLSEVVGRRVLRFLSICF